MSTLLLEIVTPERKVYEREVNMVLVKGVEGELGILPKHIPMVTPLKIAPVRVKFGNEEEVIAVHGGFMEVGKDKVVILAEIAEVGGEIDLERAEKAKKRAEERMKSKSSDTDLLRAEIALQKSLMRIDTARKRY
ncbi:F0F1 ATP synthase subunit epsilon [Longirhabdus pacifica]|uniref:F0F1 ATP synthase subunit epsilon n=1 Tax=Longirhabdus pacifica TaxID=2305227 RepID=UPI001008CA48|nr:F0F1 ATP synthase subunit epsilon [Longirhabdus pacifica]